MNSARNRLLQYLALSVARKLYLMLLEPSLLRLSMTGYVQLKRVISLKCPDAGANKRLIHVFYSLERFIFEVRYPLAMLIAYE